MAKCKPKIDCKIMDNPIRIDTADGITYTTKVIVDNNKYRIVGTKSYKEIAKEIGAPKAVRAIGGANNKNPLPIIIPCHRVIGSNGALVGYGGGIEKKEILLDIEGSIKKIS